MSNVSITVPHPRVELQRGSDTGVRIGGIGRIDNLVEKWRQLGCVHKPQFLRHISSPAWARYLKVAGNFSCGIRVPASDEQWPASPSLTHGNQPGLGSRKKKNSSANACPSFEESTPPYASTFHHPAKFLQKNSLATGMASAEFLALPGSPAFSPFRLAELKDSLNASLQAEGVGTDVTDVSSIYVHYVSPKSAEALEALKIAGAPERKILTEMLAYGTKSAPATTDDSLAKALDGLMVEEDGGQERLFLYVMPVKGTISPWSSKATSIAAVCGLGGIVQRIERGAMLSLTFGGEYKNRSGPFPFADVLHDRMTQARGFFPSGGVWDLALTAQ